MPANGSITNSSWVDTNALSATPFFMIDDEPYTGPFALCTDLSLSLGENPSTATCIIPLDGEYDEVAPSVTVPGSYGAKIKIGTPALIEVYDNSVPGQEGVTVDVLCGRV